MDLKAGYFFLGGKRGGAGKIDALNVQYQCVCMIDVFSDPKQKCCKKNKIIQTR